MPDARTLRLVPVAGFAWVVASTAIFAPEWSGWLALALGSVLLVALGAAVRAGRRRRTAVMVILLALMAGATASAVVAGGASIRSDLQDVARHGRPVTAEILVTGRANPSVSGVRFDARLLRLGTAGAGLVMDVAIAVRASADDIPEVGARMTVVGMATPGRPGERAILQVSARHMQIDQAPQSVFLVAADLREGLRAVIAGLPEPGASLIPGLTVGDTLGVSDSLTTAMRVSSLTHLTAVSGANCAIVVGLAFLVAAAFGVARWIRVSAGMVTLAAFVVLVTPEPSVVRAAVMAAIAMLAVLTGNTRGGASVLALAVTLCLCVDPWLATSLGFGLSVAATGALILLAPPLARGLNRVLPPVLSLAIAVPLSAQLVCGPLLVLINPQVPVWGVVANLLAGPAAGAATVLGLLACVLAGVPVVGAGAAALAWVPAAWIASVAETCAGLPAASVGWPDGLAGAFLLALLGGAVVIVIVPPSPSMRGLRRTAALGLSVALAIGAGTAVTRWAGFAVPRGWAVATCDVGQGDAILVRSAGQTALIDTGPDPNLLDECLDQFGVHELALVVLTHFDADHAGGVAAVRGKVRSVLHGPVPTAGDEAMLQQFRATGVVVTEASAGMTGRLGVASWRVLWPLRSNVAFPPGNQAGVVLDIRGPDVPTALFLADLDESAQSALQRTGALASPYPVVKVAHHGSADQSPALYAALAPAVAMITVGSRNDYGHPRDPTLMMLADLGAVITRTDHDGAVAVGTGSNQEVWVWRERARRIPE